MNVLIDLDAYHPEFEAFSALAADFVDKSSSLHLADVARDLRTGIDQNQAEWTWSTRSDILFKASTSYDGPGRTHADTRFALGFTCTFSRPARVRKSCTVWKLTSAATHVSIRRDRDGGFLAFHFDYKNRNQWGPQVHFQVSETIGRLPIPRLLTTAFLPTDCADVMLAELHRDEWRRRQHEGSSSRNVSVLRDAQEKRTISYLRDIESMWNSDHKSTRFTMLQDYTATLKALPDWRGRDAVAGWRG